MQTFDSVVIGGGFFGISIALKRAERGEKVALVEAESELMQRASLVNQARVHGGYHYPRSLLTGIRAQTNYQKFIKEYQDCLFDDFTKFYAIAGPLSAVTANQFWNFCERIGAPIEIAPGKIKCVFNRNLIDEVFKVKEATFNSLLLLKNLKQKIELNHITTLLNTQCEKMSAVGDDIILTTRKLHESSEIKTKSLYVATYNSINSLLKSSGLPLISLINEVTEIALVENPNPILFSEMQEAGITVMDGPFFSIMPFPTSHCYSLTHVRYTPHYQWIETEAAYNPPLSTLDRSSFNKELSHFDLMRRDAGRYLPELMNLKYIRSLYEVKTILPRNANDDGRPILHKKDYGGIKNLNIVIGAKLDNIYDILEEI